MSTLKQMIDQQRGRVLYINRGIPGSGKSTKARTLAPASQVFATDDYWYMIGHGQYTYDKSKEFIAHQWNIDRVARAIDEGLSPIVVDNCNINAKGWQPYVDLANDNNYTVRYSYPSTSWWKRIMPRILDKTFTNDDVQVFVDKNQHNVPFNVVKTMMLSWQTP